MSFFKKTIIASALLASAAAFAAEGAPAATPAPVWQKTDPGAAPAARTDERPFLVVNGETVLASEFNMAVQERARRKLYHGAALVPFQDGMAK